MRSLSVRSRVLTIAAALLLLVCFVTPLWRIQLQAPQYPEGLGMLIRINTITGLAPTDLDNINGLNHYIGMKRIEPAAVPVLHYMPWVVGGLVLFGLATALVGRRAFLFAWIASYGVAGAAGLAEFYAWSYDYGHNLASDAVIKVPGMSYQPPLIGSKQLLNFTASSWPAVGGWVAVIAFIVAVVALLPLRRRARPAALRVPAPVALHSIAVLMVAVLLSAIGCRRGDPLPIAYGGADCDVCRMRISDDRYGGELVTQTGKVHEFDSIECLAHYSLTSTAERDVRSLWVSDFDHPGHLLPAGSARFVRRGGPGSPMGAGWLAIASSADAAKRFGAAPVTWAEVRADVQRDAVRTSHAPEDESHAS